MDLDAEKTRAAGLFARALARCGQQRLSIARDGPNASPAPAAFSAALTAAARKGAAGPAPNPVTSR